MTDIFVQERSDIITSKAGKKYFTIQNDEGQKFICFNPKLYPLFQLGSQVVDVNVEAGKKEGDTPRIVSVGTKAEDIPAKIVEKAGYKADPEKTHSIERQSVLKSAVEWCGYKVQTGIDIKTEDVIKVAEKFLGFVSR